MKKLLTFFFFLITIHAKADYWTQKADFGGGVRWEIASFSIGSKGYFGCGGTNGVTGYILHNDFWEYDPATNIWSQKADVPPTGRSETTSFAIGTKGYVCSGLALTIMSDLWEYDQATNIWTQKASFGIAVEDPTGFSIGNKGYIATGWDGANYRQETWEYDPITNSWTQKADFANGLGRFAATAFTLGNNAYMGTGAYIGNQNDFWKFDPLLNTWTQIANFGGGTRREAVAFTLGNKGYVGSGIDSVTHNDFWQYDAISNSWNQVASIPVKRCVAGAFVIGNKAYVGTGDDSTLTGTLQDFWEYTSDSSTNIKDINKSDLSVSIFPNPVIDKLNITVNNNEPLEFFLYDNSSKKIMEKKFTNSITLNTEQLAKGLYLYEVRDKNDLCKKGKLVKD